MIVVAGDSAGDRWAAVAIRMPRARAEHNVHMEEAGRYPRSGGRHLTPRTVGPRAGQRGGQRLSRRSPRGSAGAPGSAAARGSYRRRAAHRSDASRRSVIARRAATALASFLVLAATGSGWSTLHTLTQAITTSNALSSAALSSAAHGSSAGTATDGSVNVLLIGLDSRKDQNGNDLPPAVLDQLHAGDSSAGGYNTNTLILMHIPQDGSRVTAFSIPRDDYVPVQGIPGNDHVKIKEAYGLKKAAVEDTLAKSGVTDPLTLETAGREAGRTETLQTVQNFLGVSIDQFAEVNLAGFYDLASALDGVQVCLNHPVQDSYSGADFPAGLQTLNAAQALAFVRQRHGLTNGDLDRTHRQQAFLASVTHQLASTGTFTDLGRLQSLLNVAKKDVVISAGWDIPTFIREARNLTGGNVQFATLPIERYDTLDGQAVNIVDQTKVQQQVRIAFGLQPPPSATSTAPPLAAPAPPITVDVLNGDGRPGPATTVSNALVSDGLTAGTIGNSTRQGTTVSYGTGAQAQAGALTGLLHAPTATPDTTLAPDTISIVLGTGFIPPPDLAQHPAALHAAATTTPTPTPAGQQSPTAAASGPQGPPVDGTGIPCVD